MAGDQRWTHRIPRESMKYMRDNEPAQDRIRAVCRAIETECRTITIELNVRSNGTSEFFVTGGDEGACLALQLIHERLKGRPTPKPPPNVVPLTAENVRQHDQNLAERRQFACGPCTFVWWRKVFQYKPVSRCERCQVRYDPIPKALEFGHGRFRCPRCGNTFSGRARPNVRSQCYRCGHMVTPEYIGPRTGGRGQRTGNQHSCEECANGRIKPCPSFNRLPVVSTPHDSTGSTISTFLTQMSEIDIDED